MKKKNILSLLFLVCISCTDTEPENMYLKYEIINDTNHILSIVVSNDNISLPDSTGLKPGEKVVWEKSGFTFRPFSNAMEPLIFYLDKGLKEKSFWVDGKNPTGKNPYEMDWYDFTLIKKSKYRHYYLSTYHFNDDDLDGFE